MMDLHQITYRDQARETDPAEVRRIVESTGFFHPAEIDIAEELVQERLAKGPASGYYFVFAQADGRLQGYACFGPIPCTINRYDVYWIAVQNDLRGLGLGKELMTRVEKQIKELGGERIYVETSGRDQYQPTHLFYKNCGYKQEAVIKDFYSPGDDKILFLKILE
ncbi:MAG: GNAT family N-acetyltransferase [Desulfobacteraceae bacterium]|nr:MAG: GNAT family N-acetyltransferase [Desulfobacteraceae bacterium]